MAAFEMLSVLLGFYDHKLLFLKPYQKNHSDW